MTSRLARSTLAAWAALAIVVGCTTERTVLGIDEVTTCEAAFLATPGTACSFSGTCARPDPTNPTCCADMRYCSPNGLVVDGNCNPDCSACIDDRQCTPGSALCTNQHCMPCPPVQNCPACPQGWQQLHRNGCATCDSAPPSECNPALPNDPNNCNNGQQEVCYPGEHCVPGCAPGDDCCANVCSSPGCQGPAPLGCLMQCVNIPCQQCAADACDCVNGAWQCTPRCIDNENVTASCIAP